jgi:hypothetical protein
MYDNINIFVTKNTEYIGSILNDLFKYLHLSSKIYKINIHETLINSIPDNTCILIIYEDKFLVNELKIINTSCIYYYLLEKTADPFLLNHSNNILTNWKEQASIFTYCPLPKLNDKKTDNIQNIKILGLFSKLLKKNINFDILYQYALNYDYNNMILLLENIQKTKDKHRYICFQNIHLIDHIEIEEFGFDKSKESVLIEFRNFPHLEFLLKNTIIKMPNDWNHTIVCGSNNVELMKNISSKICKNTPSKINIIMLPIENLTRDAYCELLTSEHFWNYFQGEHILLYQEDSILFHGNIDPFLKYDYIGAPWFKKQDDNSHHVGNGGFSLRSKSAMINVIKCNKPLIIGNSTKNYMKTSNLKCIPEDVYFSKSLIDFKLGNVASYDEALQFSQETIIGKNPLGGHAYWLVEPNKKIYNQYCLHDSQYYLTVSHRGGWKEIINNLIQSTIISNNNINHGILLLDVVSKFFLWDDRKHVIQKDWVGIIHIVPNTPDYLKNIKIENLLNNYYFKQSLKYCKGIIVLSKYLQYYLEKQISNVKIGFIKHPSVINTKDKFDIDVFSQNILNKKSKVIQLGSQLRFLTSIYKLKTMYPKIWLPGRTDNQLLMFWLRKECEHYHISLTLEEKKSVTIFYTENYEDYDNMILNNIIVIHLINASANNAIIELLSLHIPFFVNKLAAVVEYIGEDYPLYFTKLEEVEEIINDTDLLLKKMKEGTDYLKNRKKPDISLSHFNSEMLKFINE